MKITHEPLVPNSSEVNAMKCLSWVPNFGIRLDSGQHFWLNIDINSRRIYFQTLGERVKNVVEILIKDGVTIHPVSEDVIFNLNKIGQKHWREPEKIYPILLQVLRAHRNMKWQTRETRKLQLEELLRYLREFQ